MGEFLSTIGSSLAGKMILHNHNRLILEHYVRIMLDIYIEDIKIP